MTTMTTTSTVTTKTTKPTMTTIVTNKLKSNDQMYWTKWKCKIWHIRCNREIKVVVGDQIRWIKLASDTNWELLELTQAVKQASLEDWKVWEWKTRHCRKMFKIYSNSKFKIMQNKLTGIVFIQTSLWPASK